MKPLFTPFIRIINGLQLLVSYFITRIIRKPLILGNPVAVSIEPTNRCNLHCSECPSGKRELTRKVGYIDTGLYRKIVDQLSPELSVLTLYFQGEPYLHPEFTEMVRYARERSVFVWSSTNGHFLTPENAEKTVLSGLNKLVFSVDGTTQESYEQYRSGGQLETVIQGIRNLAEARIRLRKKNPRIVIQFLVLKSNEHQISDIRQFVKEWGADKLELKSAQFHDFEKGNPLIPEGRRYSRYEVDEWASGQVDKRGGQGNCIDLKILFLTIAFVCGVHA